MPSWGQHPFEAQGKAAALRDRARRGGRAASNNFLTRASGLPKLLSLSIAPVGMRAASWPLASVSPRSGRRSPRPPYSYGDTGFIDACFAGLCLPGLRPFSLAARRAEPQKADETQRRRCDIGAAWTLCGSQFAPAEHVEARTFLHGKSPLKAPVLRRRSLRSSGQESSDLLRSGAPLPRTT